MADLIKKPCLTSSLIIRAGKNNSSVINQQLTARGLLPKLNNDTIEKLRK